MQQVPGAASVFVSQRHALLHKSDHSVGFIFSGLAASSHNSGDVLANSSSIDTALRRPAMLTTWPCNWTRTFSGLPVPPDLQLTQPKSMNARMGHTIPKNSLEPFYLSRSGLLSMQRLVEIIECYVFRECSLEIVLDAACVLVALWILHRLASRRPKTLLIAIGAWSMWFFLHVLIGSGAVACLKDMTDRTVDAMEASHELVQCFARFATSWLRVFVPMAVDVTNLVVSFLKRLSCRQRLYLCFGAAAIYTLVRTCGVVRRHSNAIHKTVFQASFVVFAPAIWLATGMLSPLCMHGLLWGVSCVLPALLSFRAIRRGLVSRPGESDSHLPKLQAECCEVWLSFWACWPAMMLIKLSVAMLPQSVASVSADEHFRPSDVDRAMLVVTMWVQLWRGGFLLSYILQSWPDVLNVAIYAAAARACGIVACVAPHAYTRLCPELQWTPEFTQPLFLQRASWNIVVFVMFACVAVVAWSLYHALSLMCEILILLTLWYAAADSASVLCKGSADLYVKRLSFWVLLQIWIGLVQVPLLGACFELATPAAICLFFLAGDRLLEWFLIPVVAYMEKGSQSAFMVLTPGDDIVGASEKCKEEPEMASAKVPPKWRSLFSRVLLDSAFAPIASLYGISHVSGVLSIV